MRKRELQNLIKVKLSLADKYERKGRSSRSRPGRAIFVRHAERFRRQAADLQRWL